MENALRTGVLGSACAAAPNVTGVSRALPSTGPRPAVWGRTHEARGGAACGASYSHPSYGRPADVACARVSALPPSASDSH